jgi:hypothetical protein
MTSDKMAAANQKAFERGQQDFRDGKVRDNPYPPISPDHPYWEQGYETERDLNDK